MESEKELKHVNRIIDNLNQHWHSIQLLLSYISQPLTVDDRGLAHTLRHISDKVREMLDAIEKLDLTQTLGEIKYIGKRLNQIESTLISIQKDGITRKINIDVTMDGYEMVKKPINFIPEELHPKIEDQGIIDLLKTLTDREVKVIIHRVGLLGEKEKTYEQIGALFKVTRERVRQIYARGLKKCRHPAREALVKNINHVKLRKEIMGE